MVLFTIGFPGGAAVKNPPAKAGDAENTGSVLGSGRSFGEGNGNPLQDSCIKNPMDRGAWWAVVHGVTIELDIIEQLNNNKPHMLIAWYLTGKINKLFFKFLKNSALQKPCKKDKETTTAWKEIFANRK